LKKQPKISVIGAGYVGLCTAVGFSSKGYRVVTSDVDDKKATKINQGIPPFHDLVSKKSSRIVYKKAI
jgi:UDPglucose 6-dehydrogenase